MEVAGGNWRRRGSFKEDMVAHDRYEQYSKKKACKVAGMYQQVQALRCRQAPMTGSDRNVTVAGRRVQTGAQAQKDWCNTTKRYINDKGADQVLRCEPNVG